VTENLYTKEQRAFQTIHQRAVSAVRSRYPQSMEFRLVRDRGTPVGWTFCTAQYPNGTFGWVTTGAQVGPVGHEVRLTARTDLKKQPRGDRTS
jgi:hypothetical protein